MGAPRVLVAYGSKHGGTNRVAGLLGEALTEAGLDCDVMPAADAHDVHAYDAVVLGGALYAGRWHHDSKAFARKHEDALRDRPLWLFSSGPLDDSASMQELPAVPDVRVFITELGARGHATFGGVLEPETAGFLGRRLIARGLSGDHIDRAQVRAWADEIAAEMGART